jgi:hypothetical protein
MTHILANAFCISPIPFVPIITIPGNTCATQYHPRNTCATPTTIILKLNQLKHSELHLHHDVELEDEDLLNIAMDNVVIDANAGVVEVLVEDQVGICYLCYLLPTMAYLNLPVLPRTARISARYPSLANHPRKFPGKLAVAPPAGLPPARWPGIDCVVVVAVAARGKSQ